MILINLLPQELRLQETKKIHIPYREIALVTFVIFVLLSLYNLFHFVRIREAHRNLQKQWNALADRSAQADSLEKELGATILAEVDFYDSLVDPNLEAARTLNFISDLIPSGIWLTEMRFVRNQKDIQLVLNGLSESSAKGGARLIEIQNFANKLKEQMEQFIGPASPMNPNVKRHMKVAVTTSSQKMDHSAGELTQFVATFETEPLSPKK